MITKRTEGRIKVDYGMTDYYKYYCKDHENPVSRIIFNKIITAFNEKIVDLIINDGLEFTPTTLQMTFCIRKTQRIPKIKNGKLINTSPIDWKTTNKLWEEDSEAKEKKILIKFLNNHSSKYVFRIKSIKSGYAYTNKKLYRFKASRFFQRSLSARILDTSKDNFNCFNLY